MLHHIHGLAMAWLWNKKESIVATHQWIKTKQSMLRWSAHDKTTVHVMHNARISKEKWFEFHQLTNTMTKRLYMSCTTKHNWNTHHLTSFSRFSLHRETAESDLARRDQSDEHVINQAPSIIARRWSFRTLSLMANCHSGDACTSRRTRLMSPIEDPLLFIMRR